MTVSPPEPLNLGHRTEQFSSGVAELDDWLRKRALRNQATGASRTFVVVENGLVVGYYATATGGIAAIEATGRLRRNMPDPIPVVILARLAVAASHQGRRIGLSLLHDCAMRVMRIADEVGVRGLVVHAISEDACAFYEAWGFRRSGLRPLTLMATLADLHGNL
ncbi:MAG: GCN5-related N-acetyltransferase [Caulobacter sp.]|nr:GCN5-related N-acetyltransferase [Caulobacter sp.]